MRLCEREVVRSPCPCFVSQIELRNNEAALEADRKLWQQKNKNNSNCAEVNLPLTSSGLSAVSISAEVRLLTLRFCFSRPP